MAGIAKKATAAALICSGAIIAAPKPAEAAPISIDPPGPVSKIEIGALKAGASEVLVASVRFPDSPRTDAEITATIPLHAKKLPGKRTPPTVTLKRGMTRNIE